MPRRKYPADDDVIKFRRGRHVGSRATCLHQCNSAASGNYSLKFIVTLLLLLLLVVVVVVVVVVITRWLAANMA